jgi:membrane associated rhomboid family serine protease
MSRLRTRKRPRQRNPNGLGGAIVVIAGLIAIVAVFVVAVIHYPKATEVTTAVGAVSGVIAALVGAYFGIRGSSLAQTKAESRSSKGSL